MSVYPISPCSLALAFPFLLLFILLLSCTRQTFLRTLPLLGLPNPSIFLDYVIPSYPSSTFCCFLPYSPISYGWRLLFLAYSSLYIAISTFSRFYLFSSGYIPTSSLNTVLLVVLEHPSIFLAAVICTVFQLFSNFAFPSHTSPAYSSFGTITFIKIHILILLSRCESVRIASTLPTCDLPFSYCCYVRIPRAVL